MTCPPPTLPAPYPLSPELAAFVARTTELSASEDNLAAQREAYLHMCRAFTPPRPAGVSATDLLLTVARHSVPVRRYCPPGKAPCAGWPCLIYLHGGGFVLGNLDSHDFITAALSASLQAVVIAVDYRLAPEHPFPAAFDDSLMVWRALRRQAAALGIDSGRIAVAGDSAGGNLAAALCVALRDAGEPMPTGQALIYPTLASTPMAPACHQHADAPLLSMRESVYFRSLYVADATRDNDPRVAPLAAQRFDRLPPAFVAVAEFDPLRDDGVEYVKRLRQAEVAAALHFGHGLMHGCLRARGLSPEVDELYDALAAALGRFLAAPA